VFVQAVYDLTFASFDDMRHAVPIASAAAEDDFELPM